MKKVNTIEENMQKNMFLVQIILYFQNFINLFLVYFNQNVCYNYMKYVFSN